MKHTKQHLKEEKLCSSKTTIHPKEKCAQNPVKLKICRPGSGGVLHCRRGCWLLDWGKWQRAQLSQFSSARPHQRWENPQLDKSDGITDFYSGLWPQLLRAGVNCFELSELGDDGAGRGSVRDGPRGFDLPARPAQHLLLLLLLQPPPSPQQQLTFTVRLTSAPLLSSTSWN